MLPIFNKLKKSIANIEKSIYSDIEYNTMVQFATLQHKAILTETKKLHSQLCNNK